METERDDATQSTVSVDAVAPAVRFAFVDGLRGLSALAIVVFHLWWYEAAPFPLWESVNWLTHTALLRTRGGVQVLLVISGFVIAYTLRKTWVTPREVFSFLARRVVRLVPAYWVAIGFALLVDVLCRTVFNLPSPCDTSPTLPRGIAHLLFLQDVLGFSSLSAGLWTVCIEMQFYVVAILGWGLSQDRRFNLCRLSLRERTSFRGAKGDNSDSCFCTDPQRLTTRSDTGHPQPTTAALLAVFALPALVALGYWQRLESTEPWVTHYLWKFFLGMVTWWTLDRKVPLWGFASVVTIAVGHLVFELTLDPLFEWEFEIPSANAIAIATALAIFIAGRRERQHVWLNWPWLQYLSRISYSLYLIHFPVCHLLTMAGWRACHGAPTPVQAVSLFGASIAVSLLAAHVLYVWVEAPSMTWAARLKRRPETECRPVTP